MEIKNENYGGFIVSKNVLYGKSIRYSFREESGVTLKTWTKIAC